MVAALTPKPKGLADLVSYAALVDEGVCLLKDGGFLAAWTYTGPDLESAGHDELAVLSGSTAGTGRDGRRSGSAAGRTWPPVSAPSARPWRAGRRS